MITKCSASRSNIERNHEMQMERLRNTQRSCDIVVTVGIVLLVFGFVVWL